MVTTAPDSSDSLVDHHAHAHSMKRADAVVPLDRDNAWTALNEACAAVGMSRPSA